MFSLNPLKRVIINVSIEGKLGMSSDVPGLNPLKRVIINVSKIRRKR